ncbi:MAG TPA: redoxin domain-containing protein [Actinomycetota bacterium]|nr:redoxin domain-containing protein [Actinomycetota bacterium]
MRPQHPPARPVDRRAFLRAAGLAGLAIPLAACGDGGSKTAEPTKGGSPAPSAPTSGTEAAGASGLSIGDEIPAIRSEAVEGPEIKLEQYRGHPFVLNFWASTCEPCRREFPLLRGLIERHSDLPIVGVDVMERKEPAAEFARSQDATWPSIWDPDGSISAKFRVRVLPVTYAIGRNFKLVDRHFGELTRERLDQMVDAMLKS